MYNKLSKDLPARVNKLAQQANKVAVEEANKANDAPPYNHGLDANTCVACRKALSGPTVESVNCFFHPHCFKCKDCGRKFAEKEKAVNVRDDPYCDSCSKRAFLTAMRTHGSVALMSPAR
eukprot:gb/GEZN01014112.1/.p2 GENE.gb/GEZN01014112.1/~~gb/GEZN01014112.1/.p2  ORF type:complete len:120 (-),score=20.95 gb/GEZN01014112.1/:58-417(-)